VGARAGAILAVEVAAELDLALTPLGRLVLDDALSLPGAVAALTGTATPLQLLTERLARARGTNPDPIRRDDPVYRAASDVAEA
jgi:hypothetical protein